jgi:hypothetical protein
MVAAVESETELDARFIAAALPFWHPVARSEDLMAQPTPVTLLRQDLVLTSRVFWLSAFQTNEPVDTDALLAIEEKIWDPDQRIVESQRPVRLFAAHGEAHLPFDRLAVAYRQALTDLSFGPVPA